MRYLTTIQYLQVSFTNYKALLNNNQNKRWTPFWAICAGYHLLLIYRLFPTNSSWHIDH